MNRGLWRSGARSAARANKPARARRMLQRQQLGHGRARRGGKQVTKYQFVTSASNLLIMPKRPTRTQRKRGRQLIRMGAGYGRMIRLRKYAR
jgi:hypothetical protein